MKMTKEQFEAEVKKDPIISVYTDFSVVKANIYWDEDIKGPVIAPKQPTIMTIAASELYMFYNNLQVFFTENPDLKDAH